MATIRDAAVNLMTQLVNSGRSYVWGGGHAWTNLQTVNVLGVNVQVPAGGMDCSGSVLNVYKALGVIPKGDDNDTASMASYLVGKGFIYHDWSDSYVMRPGDLALRPKNTGMAYGHVAMCVASDFSLAEFTTASAGGPGVRAYYDYPWTICLELPDSIADRVWGGSSGGDASVRSMQGLLNGKLDAFGLARVSATGAYDAQTQAGLVRLLQASDNLDYACGLAVDGVAGAATRAAMDAHPVGLGHETQGNDVWAVKAMLVGNGWTEVGLGDWLWGATEDAALRGHQPYWGLASTGVCDGATLRSLVSAASV